VECDPLRPLGNAVCGDDLVFRCEDGIPDSSCTCEPALPPSCLRNCDPDDVAGRATCDLASSQWVCGADASLPEACGGGEGEGEGEGEACGGEATCNGVARVPCLLGCDAAAGVLPCSALCMGGAWSCEGFEGFVPADRCAAGEGEGEGEGE
jgi:hypothetical protein